MKIKNTASLESRMADRVAARVMSAADTGSILATFKTDRTSAFGMRPENARMQEFLEKHGIRCKVRYIWTGSLKGTWSLYGKDQKWTPELISKFTALGFKGFNGKPLDEYSGNGGTFSVFVRGHNEMLEGDEASKVASGGYEIEQEGGKVRRLLSEAKRELEGLMREVKDMDVQKAVRDAMDAIQETRQVVEKMIGIGMSVEVDRQVGYRSSDKNGVKTMNESKIADRLVRATMNRRSAAERWANVGKMRKDIDAMASQIDDKIESESEFQVENPGGMDFTRDYKFAKRVLEECADKLRQVEHNI